MDKPGWLGVCLFCCLSACGPGELPAFANPPPDDAATDANDGEDAGSADSGPRVTATADAAPE